MRNHKKLQIKTADKNHTHHKSEKNNLCSFTV